MKIYPKFLLITAGLLVLAIVGGYYGSRIGFAGIFPNQYTLYAAVLMGLVFVLGHYEIHGIVYRIVKDLQALDKLELHVAQHASMEPLAFRRLILEVCHESRRLLGGTSRVQEALQKLALRYDVSRAHKVKTPINRSIFHDDFETKVENDIDRVDNLMVLYVMMGFFAFIAILYLTFKNVPFPKTVEETAEYMRHLLTGLGQTYLLTIIGLGSALITHVIKMRVCDRHKGEVVARFRGVTFSVIFPVLHGSLAEGSTIMEESYGAKE